MIAAPAILLAGGMLIGLWTSLRDQIATAAAHMADRAAYVAAVLGTHAPASVDVPHAPVVTLDFLLAVTTVIGALAVAGFALIEAPSWRLLERAERTVTGSMVVLRRLHSGCVNDYIAWLVAGLAVIGAALALT
jgi:multicomponent Na+:H+ antiporter subunit D